MKKKAKRAVREKARKKTASRIPARKARNVKAVPPIDTDVRARILAAIKKIPRGKVCTYGNVAQVAGLPRRARLVGTVLRQTPDSRGLPWFRVINAGGSISFPVGSDAHARQRAKLEAEGIIFRGERIDLERYGWPSRERELDELLWRPG